MNQQPVKKGQLSKTSLENLKEGKSNLPIDLSKIIRELSAFLKPKRQGSKLILSPVSQ